MNGGTIENCYNAGDVTGNSRVGGVCGYNENGGKIKNCYNTGTVSGKNHFGGVCGRNNGGMIENCYNTGAVADSNKSYVGGVCGTNENDGTITNCHNTGGVNGYQWVGGVCGWNAGGTIENCHNTGAVTGRDYVGGVCGKNDTNSTIENCYNTGTVSGYASVGGVCGENYSKITSCYNIGTVTGGSYVGGVCGNNGGTITSCYYLSDTSSAEGKTAAQFKSGEVAWALQDAQTEVDGVKPQVWGQKVNRETDGDDDPQLTSDSAAKVYGNGKFGPNDPITREQLATMLYRYEQIINKGGFTGAWMFLLDFTDADQISSWADEAMHYMVMHGVIAGKGNKVLDPHGNATRAEAATMIQRFVEQK